MCPKTKIGRIAAGTVLGAALALAPPSVTVAAPYVASKQIAPPVAREFRGAWVATVYNLDWPSKAGLSSDRQKAELTTLLNRAADLRLNAIVFQVRPGCDALYQSAFEPWSQWLSGQMGRAPQPAFDPLELAVQMAHERGIELHAWFNPFRAMPNRQHKACASHVTRAKPHLVRRYGQHLWLDPGEPEVKSHTLKVILDVVRRYDIDGVHLDDYFYPYPVGGLEFPDEATWQKYRATGGKLGRHEWRRACVDDFVKSLQAEIRRTKPWVKFGISPFGIWRSGYPSSVRASIDACDDLAADSRKWLQSGWVDYLAPQLYWSIDAKEQSFPALLDWWLRQNPLHHHVWPGIAPDRIGKSRPASEIVRQVKMVRDKAPESSTAGHVHWSMKSLIEDRRGIAEMLSKDLFADRALVPASPWMGGDAPSAPVLTAGEDASGTRVAWRQGAGGIAPRLWVVQVRRDARWETRIHPASKDAAFWKKGAPLPEIVAVTAVSASGRTSPPAVVERAAATAAIPIPAHVGSLSGR